VIDSSRYLEDGGCMAQEEKMPCATLTSKDNLAALQRVKCIT
jgi:hypothetical protein